MKLFSFFQKKKARQFLIQSQEPPQKKSHADLKLISLTIGR